ncbi:MAG: hypothetical protein SFV20_01880 [Sphingopyxis sp.]|nr:hypothetical protein [Sphingopyxis sp.]
MLKNLTRNDLSEVCGGYFKDEPPHEWEKPNAIDYWCFSAENNQDQSDEDNWISYSEIVVTAMVAANVVPISQGSALADAFERMIGQLRDEANSFYLSAGWSFVVAGGITGYSDGVGIFIGLARPGLYIGAGQDASGDGNGSDPSADGGWEFGADGVVYQSGKIPITPATPVFYDPVKGDYYVPGQVWSEQHKMYLYPHELDAPPHFKSEFDAEPFPEQG